MSTLSINDRMKTYYESTASFKLLRKTPFIIRIDGKNFSNWTKRYKKPFDPLVTKLMVNTMANVFKEVQGAYFAYTQSDEISIFCKDYETVETDMWFGGNIQKISSITASMATAYFNNMNADDADAELAFFDCRVFNIPQHEVCNYFIARQIDGIRNSITNTARYQFGHNALQGKTQDELLQMLDDIGASWYDLPMVYKHGAAINVMSKQIDLAIPKFSQCREYIENYVYNI